MPNNIIGILLAAGNSTRFGSNKLLHILPESQQPIALQSAQNLLQALPYSVAVVRPEDSELKSILSTTTVDIIENPNAKLGMSSSLRCAIESVTNKTAGSLDTVKGWVITLADMPHVPPDIIVNIAKELAGGALICAPQFDGQRGHPVGFSPQLTDELISLEGDRGARKIIEKYANQLKLIDSPTDGVLQDIDYPEDVR